MPQYQESDWLPYGERRGAHPDFDSSSNSAGVEKVKHFLAAENSGFLLKGWYAHPRSTGDCV